MTEFLTTYGLWAALLLAVIENDVAFIAVGVVAKLGDNNPATPDINLLTTIPAAIIGAILHDSIWFGLGHFNSAPIKASKVYRRIGPTIERLANRFGVWQIFLARFVYGTRNPSSFFWGIHHLPYPRFVAMELLSLTVWGNLLVFLSFHFTGWALRLVGKVEARNHPRLLISAVVIAFIIVAALRWGNRQRIYHKQEEAEHKQQEADTAKSEITRGE